ncbi:MAG: P-loop NTPase family protein [Christensenellales bacterium]
MRIGLAKECIKEIFRKTDSVVALISERGVGKTSLFRQCAQEMGVDHMALYAAALEGPDFMGLPDKDREKGLTRYLAPQFLPTQQAVDEGLFQPEGLLILEEINRVPSDTVSVLYPLLLEKKINGHALAKGWKIGITMNPDTMNYSVGVLDDAMIDRFISIEIQTNLDDYVAYSLANSPCDSVLAFLQANPDSLLITKSASESTALSKAPTPRGWTRVQELMNRCHLEKRIMLELVSGIVGVMVATEYFSFLSELDFRIPPLASVLNDFQSVQAEVERLIQKKRMDILSLLVRKCAASFENTKVQIENLDRFTSLLPDELCIVFFRLAADKRPEDIETLSSRLSCFSRVQKAIVSAI